MFTSRLNLFLLCVFYSRLLPGSLGQTEAPSSDWDYRDTESWAQTYPSCGGAKQSPIKFEKDKIKDRGFHRSILTRYYDIVPKNMTLINTGHSVALIGSWEDDKTPYFTGGHLKTRSYVFSRMEIHWGPQCSNGSEHIFVDSGRCIEMELIHYNEDAGSMENSMNYTQGRAVLSLVAWASNYTFSPSFTPIANGLSKVLEPGSRTEITPFALSDFGFDFEKGYDTYEGSMTIPPCEENVTWLFPVTSRILVMAIEQLNLLRSVKLRGGTDTNSRPTQPLGDRVTERYW